MKWNEAKPVFVLGKRAVEGIDKHTQEAKINCIVYYSFYDETVEGVAVESRWVGDYCCPENQIIVGEQYDIEVAHNYVIKFEPTRQAKAEGLLRKRKRKGSLNGKTKNNFGSTQPA